jgi:hypothetical protein
VTTWEIPLPHPNQAQVWDKDGDPWMLQRADPTIPGGVWVEAALGGAQAETRRWGELVYQFGPISDVQPRCEMVCYLGEGSSGEILDRCLLALGHHDHHKLPPERWSQP